LVYIFFEAIYVVYFCGHLVYFFTLCHVVTRKIWQPCSEYFSICILSTWHHEEGSWLGNVTQIYHPISEMWRLHFRVARWYLFKPKIPIWVTFGRSCNGSCWYILWSFGRFTVYSVYFMVIYYFCAHFGIFSQVLVCCT
jgi:hypothetical protein